MMDTVFIKGLDAITTIGVYEHERNIKQALKIDLEMNFAKSELFHELKVRKGVWNVEIGMDLEGGSCHLPRLRVGRTARTVHAIRVRDEAVEEGITECLLRIGLK